MHRLRPKLLTEGVAIIAIFPMVFATGVGGEILAPMALPVLGGLLISNEVVDLFLPVRFYWVRRARWLKLHKNRTQRGRGGAAAWAGLRLSGAGETTLEGERSRFCPRPPSLLRALPLHFRPATFFPPENRST